MHEDFILSCTIMYCVIPPAAPFQVYGMCISGFSQGAAGLCVGQLPRVGLPLLPDKRLKPLFVCWSAWVVALAWQTQAELVHFCFI